LLRDANSVSNDPAMQSRIDAKTACSGVIMRSLPCLRLTLRSDSRERLSLRGP
jgi:hypothetical protein